MPEAPVTGLAPITDLTDEEASADEAAELLQVEGGKKKRYRDGPTLKDRLQDKNVCKELLLKRRGGKCKKQCLKKFQSKHLFEKLMDFRQQRSELHKLDADKLVSSKCIGKCFVLALETALKPKTSELRRAMMI